MTFNTGLTGLLLGIVTIYQKLKRCTTSDGACKYFVPSASSRQQMIRLDLLEHQPISLDLSSGIICIIMEELIILSPKLFGVLNI